MNKCYFRLMFRNAVVAALFFLFLCISNFFFIRKIKKEAPGNCVVQLRKQLAGMPELFAPYQRVLFIGDRFNCDKDFYFLSASALGPHTILCEAQNKGADPDTVFGIFKRENYTGAVAEHYQLIWQQSDGHFTYIVGTRKASLL